MHIDCRMELSGWAKMSKEKEALRNDKKIFFFFQLAILLPISTARFTGLQFNINNIYI